MAQISLLKVYLFFFLLLLLPGRSWAQAIQSWADAFGATTQDSAVTVQAGQIIEIQGVALAKTVKVSEGGVLRFSPSSSGHLRVVGNVVVQGRLEAQPTNDGISHRLTFEKVDEALFVGGGMMVLDTDVGLWVMGKGQLDLRGSRKTPHARLAGTARAGTATMALEESPEGWKAGDRIVITPMQSPTYTQHFDAYDESPLATVSGSSLTLSTTLKHDHLELRGEHPPVGWTGRTSWTARALNLTRNVIIEGTTAGHAHTFIHSSKLQIVEDVEFRFLGPSRLTGQPDATDIKGRYPLHFHHSKKSDVFPAQFHRVTRTVVHDSRGRAFVPHETSGVRFEGCVSHNVQFTAFWWDDREPSTDIEFLNCVASKTVGPVSYRPHRMAGFSLAQGERMTARGNLAVGTQGGSSTSGYIWDEGLAGKWDFDNNESFCNKNNGIFTWQNSPLLHDINDVVCGWNGTNGLDHGAYQTMYQYRRMWLIGNRHAGLKLHASSGATRDQTFSEFSVEGQGITAWAMTVNHPSLAPYRKTMLENWKVRGVTTGLMQVTEAGGGQPHHMLLNNWDHDVQDQNKWFHLHSNVRTLDLFEIRKFTGQTESFDLRRADFPEGTYVAAWNAKKVIIGGTPTPTPEPEPEPEPEPTPPPTPTTCLASGTILREQWNGIPKALVSALPVNTAPSSTSQLTLFEGPLNIGNNFGARIRGYICPPQTGAYTFLIAGDETCELWLSTDDNPANKVRIATVTSRTASREWNKFASQESAPVVLEAGRQYYVEALHKEGTGEDHVSVAWQMPDGAMEAPIGGNRLSPFVPATTATANSVALAGGRDQAAALNANDKPAALIYPVPSSTNFTLVLGGNENETAEISVYDLLGRKVDEFEGVAGQAVQFGDKLKTGTYLVHTWQGGQRTILKVLKH